MPGRRGVRRLYSWIDYSKARAAIKLLRMGLPSAHLRANIDWLEVNVPDWYEVPLTAFEGRVLVPSAHPGVGYAAEEGRQGAAVDLIEAAPLDATAVATPMLEDVLDEFRREGPLGVLAAYGDAVDMDPRIRGGTPVVRGSRIETGFLAALNERQPDIAVIALQFELKISQVERVLEFELAIAS